MRMINPIFNFFRIKILFFYLLPCRFLMPPLQYSRRSFTVQKNGVRIDMHGRAQRYRNASSLFDINEISCLSHIRPARQVTFHVFWPEKRIPIGKPYISVHFASGATTNIFFVVSAGNYMIDGLPGKPIVNTNILACASISCCCSCIQSFLLKFLYATFKSYKMLNVHKLCQSQS
jgi:hypothetical protein